MSAPRGSSMGMNMVTTAMAFSVSAFFVLFVFTRILCARIHLRNAAAQHAAAAQAGDVAIHIERSVRGMEPSVVTAFPTVKLGADSQRPPAQEESHCTVCLEEYQAKDVVRVLPYCGHAFHVACIDAWLKQQSTCPICRASMRATAKHRAAAATMPPVYYAVAMTQLPFQVSTSSSEQNALQAEATAAATTAAGTESNHVDETPTRLEIVISDEPASSGAACPSATHAPNAREQEHPCCETTTRQSSQGNASDEHCQC